MWLLLKSKNDPQGRGYRNMSKGLADYGFGEPAGTAVVAGETAGEAWVAVVAGDAPGDDCAFGGAGEVCAGWFFISSRRKALLATLWCA